MPPFCHPNVTVSQVPPARFPCCIACPMLLPMKIHDALPRLVTIAKSGSEPIHDQGKPIGTTLLDFWRWSTSDLVSNATRGVLAEFLIARALGIPLDQPREEWAAWDLTTPEGIKVEVKSAAYIQSWCQQQLSKITFNTPKTRAWDAATNRQSQESRRQADVYVFALLAHQDKASIDPLDLSQWQFFVLPTSTLDARTRSQHSITLASLLKLHGPGISIEQLRKATQEAAIRL